MLSCLDFPLRVPSMRPREVVACGLPRNGIRQYRRSSSLSTSQNGTACTKKFLNVVYHGPFVCVLPNGRTHGRPSREVGKSNSAEGQEDIDAHYEDTIHDLPVAVMNRSNSNLAMERDLIVERSEDLTSMKDSIIKKENESTVGNQNPGSLSDPDTANNVDQKTEVGIVDDDQLKNVQEVEQSKEHALGRLKETNLDYRITAEEHEPESNNQSQNFLLNLDIRKNGQLDSTHTLTSSDSFGQSTETGTINNDKGLTNSLEDEHLGQLKQKSLEPYTLEGEPDSNDQSKFIPHLVMGDTRELSGKNASWTPSDNYAQSTHADAREKLMKGLEAEKSTEEVARNQFQDVPPEEGNLDSLTLAGANVMNVIVVAAECTPWSKTGGLGDVVGDLPKALARRGHRVMVVVPKYDNYSELKELGVLRRYKADGQDLEVTYYHAYIDCVDFVFIDSPVFRHIGNDIYGGNWQDILKRMVLFCKAAVEVPWYVPCGGVCYGDGNLVFIANDWHTALLPVYLKAYYRNNGLMVYTRCVLVIHNVAYQGRCPLDQFACLDLPEHYMDLFRLYDPVGGEHLNIFAAGLKCADQVVTVSHGYAWELKTSEGGWGLHEIINEISWKFRGIVNGINTQTWNPKFDVFLTSDGYTNYNLETLQVGKPQCKAALQRELGLPVRDDAPIFAFIGRLDGQKGIDLIEAALPWLVGQDLQLVMLGTGRRDLEDMLRRFECQYPNKVRGWVGFSDKMAHRITAGADVLLMPSKFEPCGLNQLYAMMYGTVPVVHAVGGLRDTVKQFDPFRDAGLGWTFEKAEANRMVDAIAHCSNTYRNYKESWKGLQMRGMMQDFSWDYAAQLYEQVLVAAKYQW